MVLELPRHMKDKDILNKVSSTLESELKAVVGIRSLLNGNFLEVVNILSQIRGKIVVSGIGKSGQVGMKMASTFTSLGMPSVYLNPAEAMHGDFGLIGADDAVLAVSSSGGTPELVRLVKHVNKDLKIPVVSIVGTPKSLLAKISSASILFQIKDEGSPFNLAPMASATATMVIGDMLATALSLKNGFREKDFVHFHPGGSLGLRLTKVQELFREKGLPFVQRGDHYREALKIMSDTKLGIAAVTDKGGKIIGVISDGDIRRSLLSGKLSEKSIVDEIMISNPKTIKKTESLQAALSKMESYKITSLFVADSRGRLSGIITMHDIVENKML